MRLKDALEQVAQLTGVVPTQAFVDRGYRGHAADRPQVWIVSAGLKLARFSRSEIA